MKVLAVEHDSTDVERILNALSDSAPSSFRIERVSRLAGALARLRNDRFDVVLLDLDLPDTREPGTVRLVRIAAPRTPIVVLVSRENEAAGRAALRQGARDCLVKEALSEHALSRALSLAIDRQSPRDTLDDPARFAEAALDGLSDHIAIIDEGGFIVLVNRAWREFARANQGDVTKVCEGANYLAVCDAAIGGSSEGAQEMAGAIRAVLGGKRMSFALEYPCHSPDRERWFAARLNPFPGPGLHRAVIAHADITERRQAEADLRASEARLRALYENSLVGILFTAPDGRVFNANPAACLILGRTEEEIRGLGRFGLLDPESPGLAALLAERARTGKVQATLTYIRGDGTRFPGDTASVVFDTPEGPRTCTIINDVTEREATAERIRDFSRRLLGIREEEKHRLSAALHHDVGSMSVGVGARLQAVEEDLMAGKPVEAMAALAECRLLFEDSVKRLKDLAMDLRPPDLDILGLPVALRQHFAGLTRGKPLRISFTDATHGARIESEIETTLFRVAQECLINVVKHADARRVRVRLSIGKRGMRLSITDDGSGFDPVVASGRAGSGMGLRAVQEMMRAHGGELIVDSAPGKGTRIRALFPLQGARP